MSTDFRLLGKVSASELFDGRLEQFGVREHIKSDETTERNRCLTDGRNYMWVGIDVDGLISSLTRYGSNAPGKILKAVASTCDTDIVSEYEPQFWGFETRAEWDASIEEISRKHKEEFLTNVLNYVRGEPHNLKPLTIGMLKAEIATSLIEKDLSLLLSSNQQRLLDDIDAMYNRDHAVVITLTPEQVASAKMAITHEDDLPQA